MNGETKTSSTHPPLPTTTEDTTFTHLRLLRSRRVGATTYHRLMAEHGSAHDALRALPDVARAAGLDDYDICPEGVVAAELKAGRQAGARLLIHGQPGYPQALMDMSDAPPVLWAIGDPGLMARPMISMVGARNASALGLRMAKALARELSDAGYVIVSGLARGIDTACHGAALEGGTVAVLAGGVDVTYPPENASLAGDIAGRGLRLSEQPPGLQPMARHFPARNRIIAGLGAATIVVEAAAKSGSLITAREALEIGRDVMAVPGHPFDARAAGCNMLIRDGATLVRRAEDVIEALGPIDRRGLHKVAEGELPLGGMAAVAKAPGPADAPPPDISDLHSRIIGRLGAAPVAEDQLRRDLGAPTGAVGTALTELELDGRIARQPGGLISLPA